MNLLFLIAGVSLAAVYPLLFKWRKKPVPVSVLLVVLLGGTIAACDACSIVLPSSFPVSRKIALAMEALLPPAWVWLSVTYSRKRDGNALPLFYGFLLLMSPVFFLCALFLPIGSFHFSPDFTNDRLLFLEPLGFWFYLSMVIYFCIAVVNLELTLVHSNAAARWKIKFELIGLGSILAGMIIYYGQGLLFRALDINVAAVKSSMLAFAVIMMSYSRLYRGNGVKVYIARQMAYKSLALLGVGIYLLGLGITGEAIRMFGNSLQQTVGITVALIAGIGITSIFLSENVRRMVKLFINKNFYRNKYDYRNQWLQFTDRLSSSQTKDELLRSMVTEFRDTFGMRLGSLYLYNSETQVYEQREPDGHYHLPATVTRNSPVVAQLTQHRSIIAPLALEQADTDRHLQFGNVRFAIPIFINDSLDGFIFLGMPMSREEEYNFEDLDLMKTLAQQASSTLLNLRLAEQLAKSRELAAAGRISAFVTHDLKNLCSTIALMLENAPDHISDPDFQKDLIISLHRTLSKAGALITRLKELPEMQPVRKDEVNLLQLVNETAALVPGGGLKVTGSPAVAGGDRDELQKVALNLMLNAVEASGGGKEVKVEVGEGGQPFFRVTDAGCGMPPEYIKKELFEPFRTTKAGGLGIGLFQCKQIVEAHGGKIEVKSRLHEGSEFTVWLPKTESGLG